MYQLPAPWALLATLSGRIDPWPLIAALGGPAEVARASARDLAGAGLDLQLAAALTRTGAVRSHHPFVLAGLEGYPPALHNLPYAPPVLFCEGSLDALRAPSVAIVGTRRCTSAGRLVAAELARAVCLAGGVVVSGMAIGIDSAAQSEALQRGRTVAVLGQGLGCAGAGGARRLRASIRDGGGAVVSELLPDYPPRAWTFLSRNRIIAGLARATVVVEAPHRSGALSTARHALEAGREVLVVPWPYSHEAGAGCLDLAERGATLVRGPATVLNAAGLLTPASTTVPEGAPQALRLLAEGLARGVTLEQLAARADLTVVQALSMLAELEASGLVRRLPGQRYELA
jgi:DNA processing protein